MPRIEELLKLVADYESFAPEGDAFSDAVTHSVDYELAESELAFVSAAIKPLPFQDFLIRYGL